MNQYENMHIVTQGNVRTKDGGLSYILTRPKPMGFGLTETEVGNADRFIVRATSFAHPQQFTLCELYEGESLTPTHTEKILGY